jgi:predicted acylesterase/phospholipase RssA
LLRIDAISGTSAGAMNGALVADGWTQGGAAGARAVSCFTLPPLILAYYSKMRSGLLIAVVTLLALSTMVRGHPHFVPRPTAPIPAVNVP